MLSMCFRAKSSRFCLLNRPMRWQDRAKDSRPPFADKHRMPSLAHKTINPGNVQSAFLDKASTEAAHDYVPPSAKERLAHTKLLGPNETDTVTFNAPFVPGEYLYVCSFPGHDHFS